MNSTDYKPLALRTDPAPEQYVVIAQRIQDSDVLVLSLIDLFFDAYILAEKADKLKKHLFYGKGTDVEAVYCSSRATPGQADLDFTRIKLLTNTQHLRLLHGTLGKFTEIGEFMEAFSKFFFEHLVPSLDVTNLGEENADDFWYSNLNADAIENLGGPAFEECLRRNIEKLRNRFPTKFEESDAINRDTDAERQILEGSTNNGDHAVLEVNGSRTDEDEDVIRLETDYDAAVSTGKK